MDILIDGKSGAIDPKPTSKDGKSMFKGKNPEFLEQKESFDDRTYSWEKRATKTTHKKNQNKNKGPLAEYVKQKIAAY